MKTELKLNKDGKFSLKSADKLSYLYFPLTNFHSLKSSITPSLGGDSKIDQDSFLLAPTSIEDLHNSFLNRNMYVRVNEEYTWSITGNTPHQMIHEDEVSVEADFLFHKVTRKNSTIHCTVESFVPFQNVFQELHKITFMNTSGKEMTIKPVVSFPMYSRSADNIRDHRHVSALLNKATIHQHGLLNEPTFSFNENGHQINHKHYGVFLNKEFSIKRFWPIMEEFIGEGGSLLDPIVIKEDLINAYKPDDIISGYELTAAFEHETLVLQDGESFTTVVSMFLEEDSNTLDPRLINIDKSVFDTLKEETITSWRKELDPLVIQYGDNQLDGWTKWVTLQPILRRIYGCSFLPHHDYGRGGRGWRDLWQDSLALILMDPSEVRGHLLNNFLGVRIDGSNATIIGEKPGEFFADRNKISRVWMDHGSWPLLTTKLYIDKSGDLEFLLEQQYYFNDQFTHYTKKVRQPDGEQDNYLRDHRHHKYKGTILEHLIIQNLIPFYNVGPHNNIRLEDADWNDGLDMAAELGESVAFTSFYGHNLILLSEILQKFNSEGVKKIELLSELSVLITSFKFDNVDMKSRLLTNYFDSVEQSIKGTKIVLDCLELSKQLYDRGTYLLEQVRENEWLQGEHGSWFNGYYDNNSKRLDDPNKGNMTLTGQVFAIFSGSATNKQINEIIKSADDHLFDQYVGGYKLNTNFNEVKKNMGRMFGFAYGHKENGAMFSHMAVMYANALYKRGFAKAGHKVLKSIYNHCIDINTSKIYPGIPEYVDPKGRGMYHYLTGSASWYILTEVTEVFGIKGDYGAVVFEPKLLASQFINEHKVLIKTLINHKLTTVVYHNIDDLEYGDYMIEKVLDNDSEVSFERTKYGVRLLTNIESDKLDIILIESSQQITDSCKK